MEAPWAGGLPPQRKVSVHGVFEPLLEHIKLYVLRELREGHVSKNGFSLVAKTSLFKVVRCTLCDEGLF